MAREWISYYVYPEENKDQDYKTRLLSLWDDVSEWLASNTKKSYRLKIVAPVPMGRGKDNIYEAIPMASYVDLSPFDARAFASVQVKFRSYRDAVLFKLFFGDAIRANKPGTGLLLSLVRRVMPSIIANQIIGVSPMCGPVGKIFSMKSGRYTPPPAASPTQAATKMSVMQQLLANTRKELQKR